MDRFQDGYTWSGRRLTWKQTNSRPGNAWPIMWKICPMRRNAKRGQSGLSRNHAWIMPEVCVVFFIDFDDDGFKRIMKNAPRKLEVPMPAAMPYKISCETGKPVALRRITRQNTPALSRPMNLRGSAWKDLLTRIMKIMLQEKERIH